MKYHILTITILLILAGCGSGTRSGSTEESPLSDAPDWFLNPLTSSEVLYAVGTAKKQNPALAKSSATARARDEIARSVNVKVTNMLKDFMQESGVGDNAQALEFTESVSKQVANASLIGSFVSQIKVGKDGTLYVLVEYPLNQVREAAMAEARRQEALYNEFKANQGFDELESVIKNLDR